ncbi:3-hydroxyisobutyryl-CoA hydrolase-like protein 1, mitochondrial [Chenopodium quinoa]|uniref:3-hydroxyisobutyryl-CoA hydrolase n=2 Tax=Magnoliopsida TaxID=3398 RepID=A0A803KYN5_CHEQI|nr:3-hydroxyisobutyryl-CoA hydrolase-like protein 1, mitochondrial [Chenopodium quinoa]XP_021748210.1 3-hydroxyisobutyryl-CoA hydrolase-like protein 1, mitochondrial [Chenopodium quinoa]
MVRLIKVSSSSLSAIRRVLGGGTSAQCQWRRTFSSHLNDEVLVEGKSHCRTAVLHRPSVLNALNTNMGALLQKYYKCWEDDPDIGFVMMKGSGKAFCAGGDIVTLYRYINKGKMDDCKEFFGTLYTFIYMLGTYLKPHVALLNGISMGGGGGVSIPGTFRVATDQTVFATPETLIGFHPDAGASFYLSHLPGHIGEYLALTSKSLSGAEMLACGLATHYSLSAKLPQIEEHLANLVTDDFSVVETSLQEFADIVSPDNMSILHRMETLNKCFGHDTVEEIIDSLEDEATKTDHAWCASTLKRLREVSPLSLKVSLRSIREGRYQTLDQCLAREYRMSLQGITGKVSNDFIEGVRARMVDRDFSPKWDPPSLDRVSKDMVDEYFSPLSISEPELELPTKQREAFL